MTTMNSVPADPLRPLPRRTPLARLLGRVMRCEAKYGNVCWQFPDGKCLYYAYQVHVFPNATLDHVWTDIPAKARKQLYEGTCFSFDGEVIQYTRDDGSLEYGIKYVGGLSVNRG